MCDRELLDETTLSGGPLQAQATVTEFSPLRIGIIGGGIGGTALALACQRLSEGALVATIFERDSSFDARSQGYGLTMQQGMKVLHTLGIEMDGVGVSSSCHFSFLPDGTNIGCYGRDLRSLREERQNSEQFQEENSPRLTERNEEEGNQFQSADGQNFDKNSLLSSEDAKLAEAHPSSPAHAPATQIKEASGPTICWKCKGMGHMAITRKRPNPGPCSVCSGTGQLAPRPTCEYNIHLPRQTLRKLLLGPLELGTICWNHKFHKYEVLESGEVCVHFQEEEHPPRIFDVLVGADGIYSQVRRQRLSRSGEEDELQPLDVIVILGIANVEHPALDGKVFQTLDGETRIYIMPFDKAPGPGMQQPTMWQLSFPIPKEGCPLKTDPASLKAEALRRCSSWHPPIPALLEGTRLDNITGYPAYDRDLLQASVLRAGGDDGGGANAPVTLVGDALHPMSPFKGQGANQAMCDALDLTKALLSIRGHKKLPYPRGPAPNPPNSKQRKSRARPIGVSIACHSKDGAPLNDDDTILRHDNNSVHHEKCVPKSQILQNVVPSSGKNGVSQPRVHLDIPSLLGKYEEIMLGRAKAKVEKSRVAAQVLHTKAATVVAHCVRAGAALGHEDPENQVERSAVKNDDAEAMAKRMRMLLFEGKQ